ncbi:hypothetical protein LPY66_08850 [Dehalobacter sp. DCM]|uniref:hypothetical protein n=1 Tax=Dehalobacter sp. DCM TaxID=2907827 RepID=UPI003081D069|nr:hypothetical protein LPY66_08850 [Dehalobacter sp. DCM]
MEKRGILWLIIITVVLQLGVYFLLNWQAGQLINPVIKTDKPYTIHADLRRAEHFAVSYNKKYLACLDQDQLTVIDLISNQVIYATTQTRQEASNEMVTANKIMGFRWLPDRNAMVYLAEGKNIGMVSLYSLDLSVSASSMVVQPKLDREISMDVRHIDQIEISTYTNNLVILYKDSKQASKLLKIDIMKTVNILSRPGEIISKIAVSNKYGTIYIDSRLGKTKSITSINGSTRTVLSTAAEESLLGCQNEKAYIGKFNDGENRQPFGTLSEIAVYQTSADGNSLAYQKTILWQGAIPFDSLKTNVMISTTGNIVLLHAGRLDVISANGTHRSLNLSGSTSENYQTAYIMPPSGDGYFELRTGKQNSVYYWRVCQFL